MRISFNKYPVDIIICILWNLTLLPTVFLNETNVIWIILGIPSLFFIPGYLILYVIFPSKKTDKNLGIVERIAVSIGLSLAIISFIGILFNYTPWGLHIAPLLTISLILFSTGVGLIAVYRWSKIDPDERFTITLDFPWRKTNTKSEKLLTIILTILILITSLLFIYSITTPKPEEHFTEFYVLGSNYKTQGYPLNINAGEKTNIIIGINNHEHQTIEYTIEIWLINQSTNDNKTNISQMIFIDKITATLKNINIDKEKQWEPQWSYNYSLILNQTGSFKLVFLLFTSPTTSYIKEMDYKEQAEQILSSAYKELYLWINVV